MPTIWKNTMRLGIPNLLGNAGILSLTETTKKKTGKIRGWYSLMKANMA